MDNECECLPLARATIKGDFGTVVSKAAVKPFELRILFGRKQNC